jgi:tRNA-2-methylthio-N6-dimethylallyladenosine synthase
MNRSYTSDQYLVLIDKLRAARPGISITSDIIVGFPGETDEEFMQTRTCIARICFDDLFIFHYTDRDGTRACGLPGKIDYRIKIERLSELNTLQRSISKQRNELLIGSTLEVLFEGPSIRGSASLAGRTRSNKVVNCPAPLTLQGRTVPVVIRKASIHSLAGNLLHEQEIL